MPENKRPFKRFGDRSSRPKTQTDEDKVRDFVLRNSKNGYYTKVSTLSYKFEIPVEKAWEIVGGLLIDGSLESVHDEFTGEMKLCEAGKTYLIMNLEQQRKKQKSQEFKRNKTQKPKKSKDVQKKQA
ncbi:MAG: hypothetical protein RI100_04375 [Nitrosarchaeum sp.]|uniref:hypothetical protein n=1 Tax=Nitrosarchaeum sp. TaxID=2026886 RepID=UPI002DE7B80F|nr:hypothetical protein [Nitrosarchaeum sp.]